MYKIVPVKPIKPEIVKKAEELAAKAGALEEQITDRLHYIVTSIFKVFDKKEAYWYFDGAGEGKVGDLWAHLDSNEIHVVMDRCPGESMVILLKDGSEWGLEDSIPTCWLYEDFEEELTKGKELWEKAEYQRKFRETMKRKQSKEEAAKLAKLAETKLTKEELAALRKSL